MGTHDGHRARMKARFVRSGLDNFDDHSVLELLLFYAVPRRDVNELAHALLDHFGTLDAVFEASFEDMMRVPGVGENVATLLTLVPQVSRRYQLAKRRQQKLLRSSEEAGQYLVPLYLYERAEVVYLLCLDAKGGLISCREVGRGVVNAAEVSVRTIVETALSQKGGVRHPQPQPCGRLCAPVARGRAHDQACAGCTFARRNHAGGSYHRLRRGLCVVCR